jgi:hypothetical protein
VRLDPKLNYLCELAARAQRRTKSSFIEWAIAESLRSVAVPGTKTFGDEPHNVDEISAELWDVDEADRLVALAYLAPALLNHEEQLVWKIITTSGWFWRGEWSDTPQQKWLYATEARRNLLMDRVRDCWDELQAVVEGRKSRADVGAFTSPLIAGTAITKHVVAAPPVPDDDDLDSVPF